MCRSEWITEIDISFDKEEFPFAVEMESEWREEDPYPWNPYKYHQFKKYFSDHVPIFFKMSIPSTGED